MMLWGCIFLKNLIINLFFAMIVQYLRGLFMKNMTRFRSILLAIIFALLAIVFFSVTKHSVMLAVVPVLGTFSIVFALISFFWNKKIQLG